MESLHCTIMLLPALCGALILTHRSQELTMHSQRSNFFPLPFGGLKLIQLRAASGRSVPTIVDMNPRAGGSFPAGFAPAGAEPLSTLGQLSMATWGTQDQAKAVTCQAGTCCGNRHLAAGLEAGPMWSSGTAGGSLSPQSRMAKDLCDTTDPGVTSRPYHGNVPTRVKAPHACKESPTLPIISQTSILQTLPQTHSTVCFCRSRFLNTKFSYSQRSKGCMLSP